MNQYIKYIVFVIFIMLQTYLFGIISLPKSLVKTISFSILAIAVFASNYKEVYYKKPFVWLLISCATNMIWCYICRSQTPLEYITGNEFTNMMCICTLFAVPSFGLSNKNIEKALETVAIVCMGIYLVQYILQIPITTDLQSIEEGGQELRLRINGQCLFFLMFFKSLGILTNRLSIKYVTILIASFLCIIIIGFRSHMLVLVLASFIFLWKSGKMKLSSKTVFSVIFLSIIAFAVAQTPIVRYKIEQMIERNENSNFQNDDYIRYEAFYYYTEELPKSVGDRILGVGLPNAKSTYGSFIQDVVKEQYRLVWADWGLIGLSWMLGIPAVLCIIWYSLMAFLTPVDRDKSYLCYFFLFMLFASFLTREIYREGASPIQGIVLYLIAQYRIDNAKFSLSGLWTKRIE